MAGFAPGWSLCLSDVIVSSRPTLFLKQRYASSGLRRGSCRAVHRNRSDAVVGLGGLFGGLGGFRFFNVAASQAFEAGFHVEHAHPALWADRADIKVGQCFALPGREPFHSVRERPAGRVYYFVITTFRTCQAGTGQTHV
jgi:hypothetical protein